MTATQDAFVTEVKAMITGVQKQAPNIVFVYAGQSFTATQLVSALQALETTGSGVAAARAAYHTAVLANDKTMQANHAFVSALRSYAQSMFAGDETALTDFGLSLPKPRKQPTAAELAARAAKAKATREARGTTSKKQKAEITGNVTGVTITPITSETTTSQAPATVPDPTGMTAPAAAAQPTTAGTPAVSTAPAATTPVALPSTAPPPQVVLAAPSTSGASPTAPASNGAASPPPAHS
jgi:hypothetical protein